MIFMFFCEIFNVFFWGGIYALKVNFWGVSMYALRMNFGSVCVLQVNFWVSAI